MATPDIRIEIGLDLPNNPNGFKLDDPIQGVLDNTLYRLSGFQFYDISDKVRAVSVDRGKSQALDRIDAGVVTVTANNSDRLFDPLYESSIFFGALVPGREMRIYANDIPVFFGFIDDFDIQYQPTVDSTVSITASDAFSKLTKAKLPLYTPTVQLPGDRINTVLSLPEVDWPLDKRNIEIGETQLLDTDIAEDTVVLDYLQLVNNSEFGTLFISKDGKITFKERNSLPATVDVIISDEMAGGVHTDIPFTDISVVYGSEYLYNRVVVSNDDIIPEEAIAEDIDSQTLYGVLTYSATGLLVLNVTDLQALANTLVAKYAAPQYRFESVTVILDELDTLDQQKLLNTEIGDILNVRFEPSNIPPAIDQFCRVIGIGHSWSLGEKTINLSLEKLDYGIFLLDSPIFGVLDTDRLAY